ncbi:hypothetical protein Sjap_012654 [Stephania japonica]|uniref:Cytochrome P450 n=1 Tax=Stephania japonica TaxID=461633 RepID=A0AAP0NX01_9MAGN
MRGQHFHFIPFGSGKRGCPGTTLALQVVQTTVAAVIQCFDLKNGNGANPKVDMTEAAGASFTRAHSLNCTPVAKLDLLPFLNRRILIYDEKLQISVEAKGGSNNRKGKEEKALKQLVAGELDLDCGTIDCEVKGSGGAWKGFLKSDVMFRGLFDV